MNTLRADLHVHGPIGLQPYWLKAQGYAGKNILQLMTDRALEASLDICALTTHETQVPFRVAEDRFSCLWTHESPLLPFPYQAHRLGNHVFVVEKGERRVAFVAGQTVIVREGEKKYDHLVVGDNKVPIYWTLKDTLAYGKDHGLIQIMEHPFLQQHFGLSKDLAEEHVASYDAVEGYNAQIPSVPLLDSLFSRVGFGTNTQARLFAEGHQKPWIATSDAHRIKDIGCSYIEWPGSLDLSSEERFLGQLRERVSLGQFIPFCSSSSLSGWLRWNFDFYRGVKSGKIVEEYVPSSRLVSDFLY